MEGTSQAILGSSDQRNVPASVSLFLKSEKISALLYVGKGLEDTPFHDSICTLGLPAWGTDLKSWKGSGPSHTVLILVRVLTTKLELFSVATKSRFQFQVRFFKKTKNKIPSSGSGSKNQTWFQSGSWTLTGSLTTAN